MNRGGNWGLLASGEVLQCMDMALSTGTLETIGHFAEGGPLVGPDFTLRLPRHPDFRLIAAQNPSTDEYVGKRFVHTSALLSHFTITTWASPEAKEMLEILNHVPKGKGVDTEKLVSLFEDLKKEKWAKTFPLGLRDLLKVCRLTSSFSSSALFQAAMIVLPGMFDSPEERERVKRLIQQKVGSAQSQSQSSSGEKAQDAMHTKSYTFADVDVVPPTVPELAQGTQPFVITKRIKDLFDTLQCLRKSGQATLMVCEPGTGTSELIKAFCEVSVRLCASPQPLTGESSHGEFNAFLLLLQMCEVCEKGGRLKV